jgi:transposase
MVQLTDKQKYEIIILRDQNYKINEIADKMKINRKTVMNWINNYEQYGNIERKKESGGKRKTSIENDHDIINIVKENNDLSLTDIKNTLESENIKISVSTVYRRLIENDYVYKFPIKKPFLTEEHKKKRLEWAIKNVDRDWNKIIFSDESSLRMNGLIKKNGYTKMKLVLSQVRNREAISAWETVEQKKRKKFIKEE